MDDTRITDTAEWGEHIPLYCVNHPELRWHTKNIDYIGARNIFWSGDCRGDKPVKVDFFVMRNHNPLQILSCAISDGMNLAELQQQGRRILFECSCSGGDLRPVKIRKPDPWDAKWSGVRGVDPAVS